MSEVATVIKWAYEYGVCSPETFDTLDEAVHAAVGASDAGHEAVDSIEVVYVDGTRIVHDRKAVDAFMAPIEREQVAAWRGSPTPTVDVDLRSPDGRWGPYRAFVERSEAEEEAARFRLLLGSERVRLRKHGTFDQGVDDE